MLTIQYPKITYGSSQKINAGTITLRRNEPLQLVGEIQAVNRFLEKLNHRSICYRQGQDELDQKRVRKHTVVLRPKLVIPKYRTISVYLQCDSTHLLTQWGIKAKPLDRLFTLSFADQLLIQTYHQLHRSEPFLVVMAGNWKEQSDPLKKHVHSLLMEFLKQGCYFIMSAQANDLMAPAALWDVGEIPPEPLNHFLDETVPLPLDEANQHQGSLMWLRLGEWGSLGGYALCAALILVLIIQQYHAYDTQLHAAQQIIRNMEEQHQYVLFLQAMNEAGLIEYEGARFETTSNQLHEIVPDVKVYPFYRSQLFFPAYKQADDFDSRWSLCSYSEDTRSYFGINEDIKGGMVLSESMKDALDDIGVGQTDSVQIELPIFMYESQSVYYDENHNRIEDIAMIPKYHTLDRELTVAGFFSHNPYSLCDIMVPLSEYEAMRNDAIRLAAPGYDDESFQSATYTVSFSNVKDMEAFRQRIAAHPEIRVRVENGLEQVQGTLDFFTQYKAQLRNALQPPVMVLAVVMMVMMLVHKLCMKFGRKYRGVSWRSMLVMFVMISVVVIGLSAYLARQNVFEEMGTWGEWLLQFISDYGENETSWLYWLWELLWAFEFHLSTLMECLFGAALFSCLPWLGTAVRIGYNRHHCERRKHDVSLS